MLTYRIISEHFWNGFEVVHMYNNIGNDFSVHLIFWYIIKHRQAAHHNINRCLFITERSNDSLSSLLSIDCSG